MKPLPLRETPTEEEQPPAKPDRQQAPSKVYPREGTTKVVPTTRWTTQALTSQHNPVTSETEEEDQRLDDLPPRNYLRHVQELSEIPDDSPTSEARSAGKPLPPMLIGEGLPPVPAKLVKKYRREYLLKWPSC